MSSVAVVGGAGGMGATAVHTLAAHPDVDRVVVADRDADGADAVAQAAGPEAEARTIDVSDDLALADGIGDVDLVINTVGPFFRFAAPVLDACIAAGVDYVDICDDPEPTVDLLARHHRAEEAGVTAVVGMGASPGLSNLLVARAARDLDWIDDVVTVWPLDVDGPLDDGPPEEAENSAALVHFFEQLTGTVPVVEHGRLVSVRPRVPVPVSLPDGRHGVGMLVGHPEPVTLHRSIGVQRTARCLFLARRTSLAFLDRVGRAVERGELSVEEAAEVTVAPDARATAAAMVESRRYPSHGSLPGFFVLVDGRRGGRRQQIAVELLRAPAGMDGVTAVPAVLGALQVLDGSVAPGVGPPETTIDDERFAGRTGAVLRGFRSRGVVGQRALRPVTGRMNGECSSTSAPTAPPAMKRYITV